MTTSNTTTGDADPAVREELARLRDSIDNIDAAVVHMLAERFKATQQVGRLKAAHQLPPADPGREARQIARLRALAENAKLDPAFAEKFLNFIIAEVIRHHERIAEDALNGATPSANHATASSPGE
ncbi:chorismate mutase [Streptomyces sp. NPDC012403]|uniref:chorismate mutase n=1 Tax=unclassified Streptomyces TaxID=2593676 RepID=UPI001C22DE5B|nr:chorismate mutase [Streptomyces sp. AC558_RSS880]